MRGADSRHEGSDRTVLITGAARRIGRALALAMARDGWSVAVHYRGSRDEADSLVGEIRGIGSKAAALRCDLADPADVARLVPACAEALGPPACLINNASDFQFDSIETLSEATWSAHLDINLRAPVFLAQALARHLPDGTPGNVVNLIDQRVWRLTPEFFSYTVSKAGLWSATRMLAQALAPRIRVNAIGPGPVMQSVHQTAEDFEIERTSTPLRRGTSGDEIAAAVRFILDAPAMTGQMIALDGGQHLAWSDSASPASLIAHEGSGSASGGAKGSGSEPV